MNTIEEYPYRQPPFAYWFELDREILAQNKMMLEVGEIICVTNPTRRGERNVYWWGTISTRVFPGTAYGFRVKSLKQPL